MRILALDVGMRRIGVAVCDELEIIVRPLSPYDRNREAFRKIAALCSELQVGKIVVGLPLHLSGVEGSQAEDVRNFARKLATSAPAADIELWDERLSTVEAKERISSLPAKRRAKEKISVDSVAAAVILEDYLEWRKKP